MVIHLERGGGGGGAGQSLAGSFPGHKGLEHSLWRSGAILTWPVFDHFPILLEGGGSVDRGPDHSDLKTCGSRKKVSRS